MLRYLKHRFQWGDISFQIPDGFYFDSEPGEECDNFMRLWEPHKNYSLSLYISTECSDTRAELEDMIEDLRPESMVPIETLSINGFHGHQCNYKFCIPEYYEAWLDIGNGAALNVLLENMKGALDADIDAVWAAIDPRKNVEQQ